MGNQSIVTPTEHGKASSVIGLIAAGAAGFAFCYTYVIPIHTQSLKNEMAANTESVAKAKATEEKASLLERQLKGALGRVKALEKPNLFALGNPFPIGLGLVKIGQPIDDLERAYVGAKIEKETSFWSLRNFHSVFSHVTYYFDASSPDRKITHIRLTAAYEVGRDNNFLKNKLVEILGAPTESPRPEWCHWKLDDAKLNVYFDGNPLGSFMIMRDGYQPTWWPRKVPPAQTTTGANPPPRK